jgi:cyclopropane fatty-acyl-phospholipid synthase-like methyltransferase
MPEESEREHWDRRFAGKDFYFGTAPNAFLTTQRSRLKPGQKALAVADGEGRNGVWLAEQGLDVLSLDFSAPAQAKAKRLAAERGVRLAAELADLATWQWGAARFDVVVAIFIQFADPALRDSIFAGMKGCLKSGGLLLLQGYRPEQLNYRTGGPPFVENLYTTELLRTSFADLDILHLAEHDEALAEGEHHVGMSALIDLVARKP